MATCDLMRLRFLSYSYTAYAVELFSLMASVRPRRDVQADIIVGGVG